MTLSDLHRPPTTEELLDRFRPVLAEIAAGAVERESTRTLAHDAVALLKDAGFGALRVPQEYGGAGATLPQSIRLLLELGEADSNLVQALRAHFATVEGLLASPDEVQRAKWFRRFAAGALVGNATTERGNAQGRSSTRLTARDGRYVLNGTKYYSTGSLYADWVTVQAETDDGTSVRASVPSVAPGLELLDDWDGFGQRLTASGTTRLTDVEVLPDDVVPAPRDREPSHLTPYVQLVLLVALGGVARAARRDVVAYVRARKRAFAHGVGDSPARDPLVQEVVGRVSSAVFAVEAILDAAAREVERAADRTAAGELSEADAAELDTALSEAQIGVAELVLDVTTRLFEVGGASAASESLRLDRHWRNARVLAQHNPLIYRARAVGQQRLTGDHRSTAVFVGQAAHAAPPAGAPSSPGAGAPTDQPISSTEESRA
ncbi:acyl-CoA dehydrogenase family protein [Georgenia sp. AZ-5]|uniref:acyl-CoA dehydrogenase family protein n=1 Tax=Georgenia sp. AZ-5 TaxID=3367526 RepID=UPI003754DC45